MEDGHSHPSTGIRFIKKQGEIKHYNLGAMVVAGAPYARLRINKNGDVITKDCNFDFYVNYFDEYKSKKKIVKGEEKVTEKEEAV